jgi:mono/diheme cytochrome c family protein/glucose/arabinose dehydrogenase
MVRLATSLVLMTSVVAQRGDRPGEAQSPLPPDLVVPPAPALGAAEQLATFRLQPGFTITCFAAEPRVIAPVAAALDPDGRLWVVELRSYMNDLDASGERAATGRIVVLDDTDRDGVVDRSDVFVDQLVLPRAVLPLRGGALLITPPEIRWYPDADGDGRAEAPTTIAAGLEAGLDNPEHAANGLWWGLDHRIHLANDSRLLRWTPSGFVVEPGAGGGQWGLAQDDRGRCYFNYNEDWLRCDLVPGRYGPRAARTGGLPQLNHRVVATSSVWPIRPTPGVNRGYQAGRLVGGVLAIHTAVCAPHIYRGPELPGCDGDAFVCEPAGNLVRRLRLRDGDGRLRGDNPYEAERGEFLASTDERFRPVHLLTGADGALYVVDMYRGVIQHKNFVTTFLRRQIEARGLAMPTDRGRIWRITATAAPAPSRRPPLGQADLPTLVAALGSDLGVQRDLALRELVQRQPPPSTALAVRAAWLADPRPAVRVAATSALVGLGALTATDLRALLRDADPGVVAFALQHSAPFLVRGDRLLWEALAGLAGASAPAVAWHLALTMGEVLAAEVATRAGSARQLLVALLQRPEADAWLRGAVAAGAGPEHLVAVLAAWAPAAAPADEVALVDLARRAASSRRPATNQDLMAWAAGLAAPRAAAVLRGVLAAIPQGAARQGWFQLHEPTPLATLRAQDDPAVAALAQELLAVAGVAGPAGPATVAALSADEQRQVQHGEAVFGRACASCHQWHGNGMAGLAPPLRDSDWVLGSPERLARIVLHGVKGPIEVNGTTWSLEMPGQSHLSDGDLAAALSYVRRAFGHQGSVVAASLVGAQRRRHAARTEPWRAEELLGSK